MDINSIIFKAYDIRGLYPTEINSEVARRIGQAFAAIQKPRTVVVGCDARLSSPTLKTNLIEGLVESGVDVVDLGTITTDLLYFAVGHYGYDGGIQVSASHNPGNYNGFKLVGEGADVLLGQMPKLQKWALSDSKPKAVPRGHLTGRSVTADYLDHVLSFIPAKSQFSFKVAADANFGVVGRFAGELADRLGIKLAQLNWEPDGSFPQGRPDPFVSENRKHISNLVRDEGADLGVAWDGDGDRCVFYTESGDYVPGCFVTAILAQHFLDSNPGARIVHDTRLVWAVDDTVRSAGGTSLTNAAGHTKIKERMRCEEAVFAGETSGHYYFRDNFYSDNGLIPFVLMLEILESSGKAFSKLVEPFTSSYFVSDELNFTVADVEPVLKRVEESYKDGQLDYTDGLSVTFPGWRFNLRASHTEDEPIIRLNVESRRSQKDVADRVKELVAQINA